MQHCFVPTYNANSYSLYCIIKQANVSMLLNIEEIIKKNVLTGIYNGKNYSLAL